MKIVEVANAFDMTVTQFCKCAGYSRQSLYNGQITMSPRAKAMFRALRAKNASMYEAEKMTAKRRYEAREEALRKFEQDIVTHGGAKA